MSDFMEYKGYNGTVEYSDADKVLFGKILGIKSLLSYEGDSLINLRRDFEDVIDDYLETCVEKGIKPEKPYKGSFNVRVSPDLHRALTMYSQSHGQTLNSSVEEAIKRYVQV